MTLWRSIAMSCAMLAASPSLHASPQTNFPGRPVRLVIGFAPGGASDTFSRLIADEMGKRLGVPMIVENKPGAGGVVAADLVAQSAPDGYTILWANSGNLATAPAVSSHLKYRVPGSFTPIGLAFQAPHGLFVAGDSPYRNLKELFDAARTHHFSYGSSGFGGATHLGMELVKQLAHVDILHVPYKGSAPVLTDMIGGRVEIMYTTAPAFIDQVESGTIKLLALTGDTRNSAFPDVPTFREQGIDTDLMQWFGLLTPAGTPPDIAARLTDALSGALATPKVRQAIEQDGGEVGTLTGPAFGKFIVEDIARYRSAITPEIRQAMSRN